MTEIFRKTYHPPGTAPGTLPPALAGGQSANVRLIQYSGKDILLDTAWDLESPPPDAGEGVLWCHLQGQPSPGQLARLGNYFGLHPLALEDIGNRGQRPKIDFFEQSAFIVLNHPCWQEDSIVLEQVSLLLAGNVVVSVHPGAEDPFEPIRRRIAMPNRNFAALGAPYLSYAIMDLLVDQAFPLMESLAQRIELIEEAVLERPEQATYAQLHALRRELLVLRRQLWPTRELLSRLMREGDQLFSAETQPYLRDVYDHVIHVMDLLESYRDMTASLVDVFISGVNHRLNEVMKVLTMIATVFIPLTFIVGLYGMNFSNPDSPWAMPELSSYYGYPLVWLFMLIIAGIMVWLFKRRGWF